MILIRPRSALVACLASCLSLSPGCGAKQANEPPSAEAAVDAWTSAIEREDWQTAWNLLSPEARPVPAYDDFVAWCETHRAALQQEASFIDEGREPAQIEAQLASPNGYAATLRYDDGDWLLEDLPAPLLYRETPEEALRAYLSLALDPQVQAFAERGSTASLSSELQAIQDALISGSADTLDVRGDSATWRGDSVVIHLAREAQGWTVVTVGWNEYDYYGH